MHIIDSFLNKITMYKLTLYYLIGLIGVAVILSYFKFLSYDPLSIIIGTTIIVLVSLISNFIFSKIFNAATNVESVFITALIVALIIPLTYPNNLKFFIEAAVFSMGAKYLLTVSKRHIFNPAAVAVVIVSLLTNFSATWWVGTTVMLPFVFIGGLLIVRKTRREAMVIHFLLAYFIIITLGSIFISGSINLVYTAWQYSILNSALFFFAFIMLTEPLTSPTTKTQQRLYSYLVAFLYVTPQLRLIPFALTPEMALCIGNIFSYFISPNYRLELPLIVKRQLSPDTYEFIFSLNSKIKFIAGQYMEWTLPHSRVDSRGNRRYFSISSSPTEDNLAITVKFYTPSSSYKNKLLSLNEGDKIIAASLAGDFTLSEKIIRKPLVFIAGGVGIAPFRSMAQYILDKNLNVDIILIFANRRKEDIIFSDIFDRVTKNGFKTQYVLTDINNLPEHWNGFSGHLTADSVKTIVPDYNNRIFYLSGPQLMVQNFDKILREVGIKRGKIVKDFFPGYSEM
jgi:ferredoxin-NADP reductase/Na+-translocating ferredoxin:NAD+ oxidoreductase RnfD subunit